MADDVKTFDESYVRELRDENAKWRTKVRDLESRFDNYTLADTLKKEGIEADPSWVTRAEGQSIEDAVNAFKVKYPHLVKTEDNNQGGDKGDDTSSDPGDHNHTKPSIPPASKPSSSTIPRGDRTLDEIKKDPLSRGRLRDQYRELLRR